MLSFSEIAAKIKKVMRELIIRESGEDAYKLISGYIGSNGYETLMISTTTRFNIDKQKDNRFSTIINFKRINDIRYLNKFFESVNSKLPLDGIFINNGETYLQRKKRILSKYIWGFNYVYYFMDWSFKRVIPKLPILKKIYFFITQGRNRILSKTEILGRLYSCGFEIIEEKYINNQFYFVTKKVKEPAFDNNPTYGPLIKLKRVGKDKKIIIIYKMRTMHAYSEYIQKYIYEKNGTSNGDKANNDFRVTSTGQFFRKFWIDELPMFINLLKGDVKIVGVRPLSEHKFNMYPEEMQKKRSKYKPGIIPPFYVDLPQSFDELVKSEEKYLNKYEKHPLKTDVVYFFKAFNNIILKKARSK